MTRTLELTVTPTTMSSSIAILRRRAISIVETVRICKRNACTAGRMIAEITLTAIGVSRATVGLRLTCWALKIAAIWFLTVVVWTARTISVAVSLIVYALNQTFSCLASRIRAISIMNAWRRSAGVRRGLVVAVWIVWAVIVGRTGYGWAWE